MATAEEEVTDRAAARRAVLDALPLLAAVGLLLAGTGLASTLVGVRAGLEGFPATVTGLVVGGYYLGFLGGSLVTPRTISRVGHVRVFSGLGSLASAAVLLHAVQPDARTWFTLRFVAGVCTSGLYVVVESWLNGVATNASRGRLLAAYMVVATGGAGVGQLLFAVADPGGFAPFVLASVLVSLAVVPVCLSAVRPPEAPATHRLALRELVAVAPLGPLAAALSGFAGAAMVGAGAVYATEAGLGQNGTAALIAAALGGGLLLQAPLGQWSDRTDRRRVIAAAAAAGVAACLAAALIGPDRRVALVAVTVVAGGTAYPLYSLASAHLNDFLPPNRMVAAGSKLILVNGAGAVAGPVAGAAALHAFGPGALFLVVATAYAAVGAYAAWRITRRPAPPAEERGHYVPVPSGSTPAVAALRAGVADELYPLREAVVDVDGRTIALRERGAGELIVCVHDPAAGPAVWDGALAALAADGLRAVAPYLRTAAESTLDDHVDDLLALLRHLDAPAVSLAGERGGAAVVARFAAEHPERVVAVVLVGAGLPEGVALRRPVYRVPGDDLHRRDPDRFADHVVDFLRHDLSRPAADTGDEPEPA